MTVSKVMHDAPDIAAKTKARIRALAESMGYVPDTMARSLRSRSSQLLGLVIPVNTHPVFTRVALGVEEMAFQMGYNILLGHTINLPEREDAVIRQFLSRRVDGLLIAPVYRLQSQAPIYEEILKRQVPTIILGPRVPFCAAFPAVEADEVAASHDLTRHLLDLGHRRIAWLGGPSVSPFSQDRLAGFKRALHEGNVELDDRLVFEAGTTIEEGAKTAQQFLQDKTPFTAVVAFNDLVAIGAGTVLFAAGYQIPRDVSLAGFGNFMVGEYFKVPLTTTRQPKHRLGTAAMEAMRQMLQGVQPELSKLQEEIIVRASTGPASPEGGVKPGRGAGNHGEGARPGGRGAGEEKTERRTLNTEL